MLSGWHHAVPLNTCAGARCRGTSAASVTYGHPSPNNEVPDNYAHADHDRDYPNVDSDTPQMNGSFGYVYVGQEVDQEFFGNEPGQQEDRSADCGVRDVLAGNLP
jgi:hypothetical protein